ncbi:MAG: pilus assembly protein [Halioglobus sp.]
MKLTNLKVATRSIVGMSMLASLALVQAPAIGDDTEIYQSTLAASGNARPKVLIVMDTSGSMNITAVEASDGKPAYDPDETYEDAGFDLNRIYWSLDNDKPASNTNRWFDPAKNRCVTSYLPLETAGNFTGKAKRLGQNNNGIWKWRNLNGSDRSPVHIDCQSDVTSSNPGNGAGVSDGYPKNPSNGTATPPDGYTTFEAQAFSNWGNRTYRWYTGHYLNYWNDDTLIQVEKSRLEVAQEVVNELINVNQSIDFGLAVFNHNSADSVFGFYSGCGSFCTIFNNEDDHGGRIVSALLEDMTLAQRDELAGEDGLINNLVATGSTPLCESTYEAYRYLTGQSPRYGLKQDTDGFDFWAGHDGTIDTPDYDPRAFNAGLSTYKSPTTDCAYTYVILMTDGFPSLDTEANATIEALPGIGTCGDYALDGGGTGKNCLAELTRFMANNDLDDDDSNGDQYGITYTIGFATDQELLREAAENGKGKYYTANDTAALARAFQDAVLEILSDETSFTSPSVAVNTFTRTESRNEVFFAMFKPDASQDWRGNVKRLDIVRRLNDDGDQIKKLVDANGDDAINQDTNLIDGDARTLWRPAGDGADGPTVDQGGVGELLRDSDLATRKARLHSNTGNNGALEPYDEDNFTPEAYDFDTLFPGNPQGALYDFWEVADAADFEAAVAFGIGYDTEDLNEDDSVTDTREWILGDILHSRPRVVSYGLLGGRDKDVEGSDLRVLVGTNAGFLHMFGNDDGVEDWAFFPKELAPLLTSRRLESVDSSRPYGIDSPPVIYSYDDNKDGTYDKLDGDKVWAFFGLRRGGRYLYGLDISDPNNPESLWGISPQTDGFEELGQTWSVPKVAYIPGHADNDGKPKPVLVFGAGYDTAKDDHTSLGDDADSMGRGIFIIDAETGALLWSVTPAADSATNMQATELEHSVPASVATLDSNGDRLVDRLYFGDTAGIVWRVDMPGATLPDSSQSTWRLTKLFVALDKTGAPPGTTETRTQLNDRRFFNQPDVVRISRDGKPVDAVLIGTGDRTNPGAVDGSNDELVDAVENAFYLIPDQAILPFTTDLDTVNQCDVTPAPEPGSLLAYRCSLPMHASDLYDATSNILESDSGITDTERTAAQTALYNAKGWKITLAEDGEKSLSKSITITGKVFFGTFVPGGGPGLDTEDLCRPPAGQGRLYAVSLYDATTIPDYDNRYSPLGNQIPDTPALHVSDDGTIGIIPPQGAGGTGESDLLDPFTSLAAPYGSYWYRKEY